MSMLLALPAVACVLVFGCGIGGAIRNALLILGLQILIAVPFISKSPSAYLEGAFNLARGFDMCESVNWQFLPEELFKSRIFMSGLMLAHIATLVFFAATRWARPSEQSLLLTIYWLVKPPSSKRAAEISASLDPTFIMTLICTSITIGLLFARSLHPQFYALIAWSTPFLLWRSGMHPLLLVVTWCAQEWSWNQWPSTSISSVITVLSLLVQVVGIWWGTWKDFAKGPTTYHQPKKLEIMSTNQQPSSDYHLSLRQHSPSRPKSPRAQRRVMSHGHIPLKHRRRVSDSESNLSTPTSAQFATLSNPKRKFTAVSTIMPKRGLRKRASSCSLRQQRTIGTVLTPLLILSFAICASTRW